MGTPSRKRRLAKMAATANLPASDQNNLRQQFTNVLSPQDLVLYDAIMASVENRLELFTGVHVLDTALAVASGLLMAKCLDNGNFDEVAKLAPMWRLHAAPLIQRINDELVPKKRRNDRAQKSISEVFADLLDEDTDESIPLQETTNDFLG